VLRSSPLEPTDKYRFSTHPELLEAIGVRLAELVARAEPSAVRLAAPELGAVPLAAAASLVSRLPFVIVRTEAKRYGTGNRLEGVYEPGESVCLIEDVVTSGGAAVQAGGPCEMQVSSAGLRSGHRP
jgi:orotate phosphoribosyltransferase